MAKRGGGQNLARMAPWKPFWETLRKLFLRGSLEVISGSLYIEAQQRYLSYRAILVAIVSQTLPCLFLWYRTIIVRYVAKRGIAQMCLCELSHHFGGVRTSLKK